MRLITQTYHSDQDILALREQINQTAYTGLLIQVFSGNLNPRDIQHVVQALRQHLPDAHIMGATTGGEIIHGRTRRHSIALCAMVFERCSVQTCTLPNRPAYEAGEQLANSLCDQRTPAALIVLADGIHTNGDALARGIESVAPDVPMAGGLAGDNLRFKQTWVFDAESLYEHGVVAAAIYGPLDVYQHANFNWHPIGPTFRITRAKGNLLKEINHIPAIRFFQNVFGEELIPANLERLTMAFPIILHLRKLRLARVCVAHTPRGDMVMAGDIPEGTTFQFGIGSPHSIIKESCVESAQLINQGIEGILVYSCIGRHMLLKRKIEEELRPLQTIAETCGFFTYGELGRLQGHDVLLNNTTTLLALSEHTQQLEPAKPIQCPSATRRDADLLLSAMSNFAQYISSRLEIENRKVTFVAEHDPLTGALNRLAGEKLLNLLKELPPQTTCVLALIDLDHFKQVNDTHGHQVGDRLLKFMTRFFENRLRKEDSLIRWGGEEFLLILKGVSLQQAKERLEQLLAQFRSETQQALGFAVSFSAGLANFSATEDINTLLKRADQALYRAKANGRARIEIAKADGGA